MQFLKVLVYYPGYIAACPTGGLRRELLRVLRKTSKLSSWVGYYNPHRTESVHFFGASELSNYK